MESPYPFDFPPSSRARVEAAKAKAALKLEESKGRIVRLDEYEAALRNYILLVFAAFAAEALELGRQGVWAVQRLDSESREFLERITLQAQLYKGYDPRNRAIVPMVERVFGHLLPEVRREFEQSSQWRSYQEGLSEVAELQASKTTAVLCSGGTAINTQGKPEGRPMTTLAGISRQKAPRRSAQYLVIDKALQEIAKANPRSFEEVVRLLDGRVKVPNAEPFRKASGWVEGYARNKAAAQVWLSKAWSRLALPPLPKGPKK